jgi:hypothetical protein
MYNLAQLKAFIKVGDYVKSVDGNSSPCGSVGRSAAQVTQISDERIWFAGCSHFFTEGGVVDLCDASGNVIAYQSPTLTAIKTSMSTLIEKFQNFFAEPTDLMLKKYGIENPTGTPTQAGLDLLLNIMYRERRADVIAAVTKIADADDAEAAKTK